MRPDENGTQMHTLRATSLAGPDLPGEGRSGRYCQHSVDGRNVGATVNP